MHDVKLLVHCMYMFAGVFACRYLLCVATHKQQHVVYELHCELYIMYDLCYTVCICMSYSHKYTVRT